MPSLSLTEVESFAYIFHKSPPTLIEELVYVLHKCRKKRNLSYALQVHAYMCYAGLESHALLGNCLVEVMVEGGSVSHAQMVFDKLSNHDECSWNSLITGYVDCGEVKQALALYKNMWEDYSLCPSVYVFVTLLKACTVVRDLERGDDICAAISGAGLLNGNMFLGSALVSMYTKCGALSRAKDVFERFLDRNVVLWNTLVAGYSENGLGGEALQCLDRMQQEGIFPDGVTLVCSLKACSSLGAIMKGQEIHTQVGQLGLLENDIFVGNALVDLYAKCGYLVKAQNLFDSLTIRDIVSWNALIAGYANHGQGEEVLSCYRQMQKETIAPDEVTLVCSLKACGSTGATVIGQEIHNEITVKGLLETDAFTGSALVYMYANCDLLATALQIFNSLPFPDLVSWNALVAAHADLGNSKEALECMDQMQVDGICLDSLTLIGGLKACSGIGDVYHGHELHSQVIRRGWESDPLTGSTLVDMYFKCGLPLDAQQVFDGLPSKVVVAWNALIAGYIEHGNNEKAVDCFEHMQEDGTCWDAGSIISSLKACSSIGDSFTGQEIHAKAVRTGLVEGDLDLFVSSALIDMYAKCGLLQEAQITFDKLPAQDVVTWTALISGYVEFGLEDRAFSLFLLMQQEGIAPGVMTLGWILKACGNLKSLDKGQEIHAEVVRKGLLEKNSFLCSALVDMYGKCDCFQYAQVVFNKLPVQDVASWTALILGFAENGDGEEALLCFEQLQYKGVCPSSVTLICGIKACGNISNPVKGKKLHSEVTKKGLEDNLHVGNALVDMYSKCGCLEEAKSLFDELPTRDDFSWSALSWGYAEYGGEEQALLCFKQMQLERVSPCTATLINILKVCGSTQNITSGRELHAETVRKGFDINIIMSNMLADMYVKWGLLEEAQDVFDKVQSQNVVFWNTLISGHVEHKEAKEAINCYEKLQQQGVSPDFITFLCSLKACGAIGAVKKGQEIHAEIVKKGWERELSVQNTFVDMYTRCGSFEAAQNVFQKLQDRDVVSWTALISGLVANGDGMGALDWFEEMQREGVIANAVTLVCLLKACGSVGVAAKGKELHVEIAKVGLESELHVGNILVDMYAKCGFLAAAQDVFAKLPIRDLVSWNALMVGYAQLGDSDGVFYTLEGMINSNTKPNSITFVSVLNSCSHAGLLDMCQIYFDAIGNAFGLTPILDHYTCIVDALCRAALVEKSMQTIVNMPLHPSIIVWQTFLGACQKLVNVETAKLAFKHLVQLDKKDPAAYVCMANIHAAAALQGSTNRQI